MNAKKTKVMLISEDQIKLIINIIKTRKLRNFRHIIRHALLSRALSEGHLGGRTARGRPKTTWTINIFKWTGLIYSKAVRDAVCKTEWRVIAPIPISQDGTR